MNFLGILFLIGVVAFFGWNIFGLVKDIKNRKSVKAKNQNKKE